ncbi:MAG: hypothetical protein M3Z54_07360 [Gemmatimonadota bacterium]|nr:hypothetical protein [Gemmatimonadota bacterium]
MRRSNSHRFRLLAALGVVSAVAATACNTDKILTVNRPDIVPITSVTDKTALPTVYGGVLSDFQIGFNGNSAGQGGVVNYSGVLGDEFYITDTFTTRVQMDARNTTTDNAENETAFRNLARSRQSAEQAAAKYAQLASTFVPGEVSGFNGQRAEIFNIAGLDYVLFAEIYCSGVPFDSVTTDGAIVGKPGLSTVEILRTAINRFDSATAVAASINPVTAAATAQLRLARVGKARAYLDMANTYGDAFLDSALVATGGTSAATGVPTTFSYLVSHSNNTIGENNGVWSYVINQARWGEANREGSAAAAGNVGLAYRSQFVNGADVRTAFLPGIAGFNNVTNFRTQKYPARETPIVAASGTEARLIEAEAYLRKNDIANWLIKINDPRRVLSLNQCAPNAPTCTNPTTVGGVETSAATHTTPTGLADLVDPGTQVARENLTFAERAFWMYATAHRIGDMRRLIRQIGRQFNAVYPTGAYILAGQPGGVYGPAVNFPIPITEESNGIYKTASCSTTTP